MTERKVDVAIIGTGSAGLFALSKVRKATDNFVIINGGELGTTCARVGCMPSKALLQVAEDFARRQIFTRHGIGGHEQLRVDITRTLDHVRDLRDIFVDKVLDTSTDNFSDEFVEGYARFITPTTLDVDGRIIRADKIIIATGSRPYVPPAWSAFSERIITTDTLFEREDLPASIAVVGLGVIGLEIGQALHRLGIQVTGVDKLDNIGGLRDPVVNQSAIDILGKDFPLWLGQAAELREQDGQLQVSCGEKNVLVDAIFASLGRVPNLEGLDLDKLGVARDARGVPRYDPHTMQIGDLPVFIAGDVNGDRAILHEAGDEGRIAGYNAVQDHPVAFRRKTPLAITFCDPNIASVGTRLEDLDAQQTAIGEMRFGALGRALIMGKNKGVLRVYADKHDGRLRGAEMIGPRGEHLAHELAWCIQLGLTVFDVLQLPFYHPVIEEGLQAALHDLRAKLTATPTEPVELRRLRP